MPLYVTYTHEPLCFVAVTVVPFGIVVTRAKPVPAPWRTFKFAVVTYDVLMLSSLICVGCVGAGVAGWAGAGVDAAFVKYVFATKPVWFPNFTCDHVPSTFKTVTLCPFGIVVNTRAVVDFEARRFKFAVVFDAVVALGVTIGAVGAGAGVAGCAGVALKKSLCTQPVRPLYVTCVQTPLVLSGVSRWPRGIVRRTLCVVPAPLRRFKFAVVVRVAVACVALLFAGASVTAPESLSVCPMAIRSDVKLFTDFNVASGILCCWLIDQSVSPARTVCVLAAAASSA